VVVGGVGGALVWEDASINLFSTGRSPILPDPDHRPAQEDHDAQAGVMGQHGGACHVLARGESVSGWPVTRTCSQERL
jgi:hypothetical protein